jgi:hypothetical protein
MSETTTTDTEHPHERSSADPRRSKPIKVTWNEAGCIGRIIIANEYWGAVEWSEKRQCWCIEDTQGRCLAHRASIHGTASSKAAAVALAEEMIRDGRMPTPEEAYDASIERRRLQREKRDRQPAVKRRRAEAKERWEQLLGAMRAQSEADYREDEEKPLYEMLHEVFDFADPELWKSNTFAMLRPRLIIHLQAIIAHLEYEQVSGRQSRWGEKAYIEPRLAKACEILDLLQRR